MEVQLQEDCKVHNKFQSFKCFDCNIFICPNCLKDHPHKKKLIRTEVTGHFLSYVDSNYYQSDYPRFFFCVVSFPSDVQSMYVCNQLVSDLFV